MDGVQSMDSLVLPKVAKIDALLLCLAMDSSSPVLLPGQPKLYSQNLPQSNKKLKWERKSLVASQTRQDFGFCLVCGKKFYVQVGFHIDIVYNTLPCFV